MTRNDLVRDAMKTLANGTVSFFEEILENGDSQDSAAKTAASLMGALAESILRNAPKKAVEKAMYKNDEKGELFVSELGRNVPCMGVEAHQLTDSQLNPIGVCRKINVPEWVDAEIKYRGHDIVTCVIDGDEFRFYSAPGALIEVDHAKPSEKRNGGA